MKEKQTERCEKNDSQPYFNLKKCASYAILGKGFPEQEVPAILAKGDWGIIHELKYKLLLVPNQKTPRSMKKTICERQERCHRRILSAYFFRYWRTSD